MALASEKLPQRGVKQQRRQTLDDCSHADLLKVLKEKGIKGEAVEAALDSLRAKQEDEKWSKEDGFNTGWPDADGASLDEAASRRVPGDEVLRRACRRAEE